MAEKTHFLLIEDNEDHSTLVKRTLERERVLNTLEVVASAEEALVYLRRQPPFHEKPIPDVIIMDINLPGMSGFDLLKTIKSEPLLKAIPVVVLTTSSAERDRQQAYELRANSYLTKPINFESFRQMIRDLGFYWTVWNQGPITQEQGELDRRTRKDHMQEKQGQDKYV